MGAQDPTPAPAPRNIEADYDAVVTFHRELTAQQDQIVMRARSNLSVGRMFRYSRMFWRRDVLLYRVPKEIRDLAQEFASPEEKATEAYDVLSSEYPDHALAGILLARYPDVDFSRLVKLHGAKTKQLSSLRPKAALGLALGASALVLKTIPKSVVTSRFSITYDQFEERVFWVTLAVLGYLLFILLPFWFKNWRALQGLKPFGHALKYVSVCAPPAPGPKGA